MSSFTADHLPNVIQALLPMPCHAKDRALVLANPSHFRVHTSHFKAADKVPGQGGHVKLKSNAVPIPVPEFRRMREASNTNANKENVDPITRESEGCTGDMAQRSTALAAQPPVPVQRRVAGLTRPRPQAAPVCFAKRVKLAPALAHSSLPNNGRPPPAYQAPAPAVPAPQSATPVRPRPLQSGGLQSSTPVSSSPRPSSVQSSTPPSIGREIDPTSHVKVLLERNESALQTEATVAHNRGITIRELRTKIQELQRQVEQERTDKEELKRDRDRLRQDLRQARQATEEVQKRLEDLQATTNLKLSWDSVMTKDCAWNAAVAELTGVQSDEVLQALYDWVNWNGQAERIRYWNGKQTIARMKAVRAGSAKRKSVGRKLKSLSPQDALLATLVKLRTGLGTRVISTWMGLPVGTLSRVFVTWISFLDSFFNSEFPVPPVEAMQGKDMDEWKRAYGTSNIRLILDCTELRVQQPCSRKASRTLFSHYKHYHTAKLLAAISPLGAYCGTSDAFPGRISDLEIMKVSPFMKILNRGDCVPTDKGFDQLSELLEKELECYMVAPVRRMAGKKTYTTDERDGNKLQSNLRIHVERHFSRLQGWGFFSQKKIPLYSTDILSKIFNVVGHLCNLYKPLRNRRDLAGMVDGV